MYDALLLPGGIVGPAGDGGSDDYRRYLGLGIQLPIPALAGALLGWWLDGRLGTQPWLLVAGASVGTAAGFGIFLAAVLRDGGGSGPRKP
jgi:hypothetical protein